MFFESPPIIQALIKREGELPKMDGDAKGLDNYSVLLQDVTAAGAKVFNRHDRAILSDLMYRLASAIVIESDVPLSPPVLEPYKEAHDHHAPQSPAPLAPQIGMQTVKTVSEPNCVHPPQKDRSRSSVPTTPVPANDISAPSPNEVAQREAFELVSWAAMARAWKNALDDGEKKQATGLLVSGNALIRIKGFAKKDRNIDAFVKASEKAEMRQRRHSRYRIGVLLTVGVVTAAGATWATSRTFESRKDEEARQEQSIENERYIDAVQSLNDGNTAKLVGLLKGSINEDFWGALDRLTVVPNPGSQVGDSATVLAPGLNDQIPKNASLVPPQPDLTSPTVPEATASEEQRDRLGALWDDNIDLTCSGAMWLGDAEISRVVGVVDLATLAAGEEITTTNWQADSPGEGSINLRAKMPDATYKLGRFKGVVPDGATVRLDGPVESKLNGDSPNYWAPVTVPREFCTRVDLRYANDNDLDNVSAIGKIFKEQGFIVPSAEQNTLAVGLSEVRYFSTDDENFIERMTGALADVDPNKRYNVWPLLNTTPRTQPETGAIEVWLDFS